jgi:hypothetical protein
MKSFIIRELLAPIVRRTGTFLGGFLVSVGMEADLATQIEASVIALVLFSIDLVNSYVERKNRGGR